MEGEPEYAGWSRPALLERLDAPPVFVVGAARSGTTWVYDILTAHPQVAGLYESWLFTENGVRPLFSEAHSRDPGAGLGPLLERGELIGYVREMVCEIMSHVVKPEHRFLVEKSPSHLYDMSLIAEFFPDARFIHVLRDGRDVAVSVKKAARSWQRHWSRTFGRSVAHSAGSWANAVKRARTVGASLGDRFLEVRYEMVHDDPRGSYRRLYDFCGFPYDDELLDRVFARTDFKRNFTADERSFRRGGRIGDHSIHLSRFERLACLAQAGAMLVETGYVENSPLLRGLGLWARVRPRPFSRREATR